MKGLNNPIGYKSNQILEKPFIMNPFRFASGGGLGTWKELDRTTLGSTGDTITVSSLADKRYYMVLGYKQSSGNADFNWRVGNGSADSGNNYARRQSSNGGAESTNVNYDRMFADNGGSTTPSFQVAYFTNLSGKEKLNMTDSVGQSNAGAGTAPVRRESVNKWVTSSVIDVIQGYNAEGGDFASGSEVVVLGWDTTDTHTTADNFWQELANVDLSTGATDLIDSGTFAAKKYLWIQLYVGTTGGAVSQRLTFNGDTSATYAQRRSSDGGTDVTGINGVNIDAFNDDLVTNSGGFTNMFIVNNSANEKLGIVNSVSQESAGSGTSPTRDQGVLKWINTSSQITQLTFTNNKAGDMNTNTTLKVWGSD